MNSLPNFEAGISLLNALSSTIRWLSLIFARQHGQSQLSGRT